MKKILLFVFASTLALAVTGQPTITKQPDEPTAPAVCEGDEIVLSIEAADATAYQWEISGQRFDLPGWVPINNDLISNYGIQMEFSGENTAALTISNVSNFLDSAQIRCKAFLGLDIVNSSEPFLRVYSVPSIDRELSDLRGCNPADINIRLRNSNPFDLVETEIHLQ